MEKIVIDTNLYYALLDISKNPKVSKSKFSNYDIYITSPTLIEMIIKFKNDLCTLKKLLGPLIKEEYKFISIGYAPIDNEKINAIFNANHIHEIKYIIDEILELRILKESEFIRWFFVTIMSINFEILEKVENYEFKSSIIMQKFQIMKKALFEANIQFILDDFVKELRHGYAIDKAEKHITKKLYDMMQNIFFVYLTNYYMLQLCGVKNNSNLGQAVAEKIKSDIFYKKFILLTNENKNPFSFLKKNKYKEEINKNLDLFMKELANEFYKNKLTPKSILFIKEKMLKIFTSESKLLKNDVFDLLISMSIEQKEFKLLSLDKKFISLIKNIDVNSYNLIIELGLN